MIPICLVTGFLGSGKTTLLKQIVATHRVQPLVFLVNEFSPRDIDGAIVSADNPNVVSVPGGSIFCKCLVTQFIEQMNKIPQAYPKTEGVIIEASGMANPKVMHTMLRETRLDQLYRIARIIAVVDPGSFHKLRRTLPGIIDQIETADLAIINKSDRFDEATCRQTADALREINPELEIISACRCNVPFELFPKHAPAPAIKQNGDYALCRDPRFDTRECPTPAPINPDVLTTWLKTAEKDLYRLKGSIHWQNQTYHVDWTTTTCTITPAKPQKETAVVLIHCGSPSDAIETLMQNMQSGS